VPELVLQLTRAGFLALLWLFVLAALRVVPKPYNKIRIEIETPKKLNKNVKK